MVLDTSAILAILLAEPEAAAIAAAIEAAESRVMSAANLVESSIVIETRFGDAGQRELDYLVYRAAIEIVPVDREQADIARAAWRRFGKGRHQAGLNFGDCFSYALSRIRSEPLCFRGDDFSRTDVESAL
ncbi:MAG: type II toxin-antitoxin system VapC family toxin [Acidobacteria bacterium]|nr:type II toxin-antitoxin system VapC family toxin [Acidobacteriota bacterium]